MYSSPEPSRDAKTQLTMPADVARISTSATRRVRRRHCLPWVAGGCVLVIGGIVVGCAILVGALAGIALRLGSLQHAESTSIRTLSVSATPRILVENAAGNVTIVTGQASKVTIEATRRASAESADVASRDVRGIPLDISQDGDTVRIHAGGSGGNRGPIRTQTVDLLLTIPSAARVDARVDAGDVNVTDVKGTLALDIGAGNISVSNARLVGVSTLHIGAGNTVYSGTLVSGASLQVHVGTGNVDVLLPVAAAVSVDAAAAVGDVSIPSWTIPVTHTATGASAQGQTNPDAHAAIVVRVDTGKIEISAT